ncbi:MAG: phosphoribosylanthranilate isomerase [Burkholderiales bacterium]|nr:phosphoribosylanthranilate isomerase [Burkholderiales bacterium]
MAPVPRVKVCCIASLEEARLAQAHGAAAIGLVSAMPSGPGVIGDAQIAAIAAAVGGARLRSFLLTARTRAADIAAQHRAAGTTTLQLVDALPPAELRALRALCPGVELVQVVHVGGAAALDEALAVAPWVDAILLDSGRPTLAVKQLGGTGRTHDWAVSRRIRDAVAPLPLWLAGGLRAQNVAAAIAAVQPHGLDLCTGVRHRGRLDAALLGAFMAVVHGGAGPAAPA